MTAISDDNQLRRMNGVFHSDSSYLFRGPPSAVVDERWSNLMPGKHQTFSIYLIFAHDLVLVTGVFSLSHEGLMKIGASQDSVKLLPKSGGG